MRGLDLLRRQPTWFGSLTTSHYTIRVGSSCHDANCDCPNLGRHCKRTSGRMLNSRTGNQSGRQLICYDMDGNLHGPWCGQTTSND